MTESSAPSSILPLQCATLNLSFPFYATKQRSGAITLPLMISLAVLAMTTDLGSTFSFPLSNLTDDSATPAAFATRAVTTPSCGSPDAGPGSKDEPRTRR